MNVEQLGIAAAVVGACLVSVDILGEARMHSIDAWARQRLLSSNHFQTLIDGLKEPWKDVANLPAIGLLFLGFVVIGMLVKYGVLERGWNHSHALTDHLAAVLPKFPAWIDSALFFLGVALSSVASRFRWAWALAAPLILYSALRLLANSRRDEFLVFWGTILLGAITLLLAWSFGCVVGYFAIHFIALPFRAAFALQRRYGLPSAVRVVGFSITIAGLLIAYYASGRTHVETSGESRVAALHLITATEPPNPSFKRTCLRQAA